MTIDTQAKLAVAYSGLVWGLFWLPLRGLDAAGIRGMWALLFFYGVPAALALPWLLARWRPAVQGGFWLNLLGFATALPLVLYSVAVLQTEVVRAMLLFYMSPVWSTGLAWLVLGERITAVQWLTLLLAFLGLGTMLGTEQGLPSLSNLGDWSALLAGLGWSVSTVLLRLKQGFAPADLFHHNVAWSAMLALPLVWLFAPAPAPSLAAMLGQLWWLAPTLVAVVLTGVYASMWGAPKLSPALVGILYMTEIIAGSISAALWAGEPFGWREAAGIALIALAASLESLRDLWLGRRAPN